MYVFSLEWKMMFRFKSHTIAVATTVFKQLNSTPLTYSDNNCFEAMQCYN